MKLMEIKGRVEFRMNPLLQKGVRVLYKNSEFSIVEYDYFDSSGTYVINVSDRTEPLEFKPNDMAGFLDSLKRKDGVVIPKFYPEAETVAVPVKKAVQGPAPVKPAPAPVTQPARGQEITVTVGFSDQPKPSGKFVHIESTVKIYVTKDYGLFSVLQGNRGLNKRKIKKIMDEIAAGTNLLKECPIVVKEHENKLKVIDGQHRLEVAKQISSYVYYIVKTGDITLYEIAKMNSNTEKWTAQEFINCYMQSGNENYAKLREFISAYHFPVGVCLQLLARGTLNYEGGKEIERMQQGKFVVKEYESACNIANQVIKFDFFPAHKAGQFVIAISKILEAGKIGIDDVAAACKSNPDKLVAQRNWKDYLVNLETIVNIGKSKRRVIF